MIDNNKIKEIRLESYNIYMPKCFKKIIENKDNVNHNCLLIAYFYLRFIWNNFKYKFCINLENHLYIRNILLYISSINFF